MLFNNLDDGSKLLSSIRGLVGGLKEVMLGDIAVICDNVKNCTFDGNLTSSGAVMDMVVGIVVADLGKVCCRYQWPLYQSMHRT
jgi:hypothetical protein